MGIAVYYNDTYNTQMREICRLYIAADDIDRSIRQWTGHYCHHRFVLAALGTRMGSEKRDG